jgi:hypothetical protein
MHLINFPFVIAATMVMTLNLSEELILGISTLILLSALGYVLADDIYDFSFTQRNFAAQKVFAALQDLEKTILTHQHHLQQISYITNVFQRLAIETSGAKVRSILRRQNEFSEAVSHVFDDVLATIIIYELFQVEAYKQAKLAFWTALNK